MISGCGTHFVPSQKQTLPASTYKRQLALESGGSGGGSAMCGRSGHDDTTVDCLWHSQIRLLWSYIPISGGMRHEFVPVRRGKPIVSGWLFGPDNYPKENEEGLKRHTHTHTHTHTYIYIYIYIYRVSHELRSLLRESVPYVKIYR